MRRNKKKSRKRASDEPPIKLRQLGSQQGRRQRKNSYEKGARKRITDETMLSQSSLRETTSVIAEKRYRIAQVQSGTKPPGKKRTLRENKIAARGRNVFKNGY